MAPRILNFSIAMDADYSFYVKTIETYARAFLALNISAIGRVYELGNRRLDSVDRLQTRTCNISCSEKRVNVTLKLLNISWGIIHKRGSKLLKKNSEYTVA